MPAAPARPAATRVHTVTPAARPVARPVSTPRPAPRPATPVARPAPRPTVAPRPTTPQAVASPAAALAATAADYSEAKAVLDAYSKGPGRAMSAGLRSTNGAWNRGLLRVKQAHDGTGSLLTVYSGHQANPDSFRTLNLQVKINGRVMDLFPLQAGPVPARFSGQGFDSVLKFKISDADLNAALARVAPGMDVKALLKNAQFAVAGVWQSGHTWGGFNRDGVFPLQLAGGAVSDPVPNIVVGMPSQASHVELDVRVPIHSTWRARHRILDIPQAAFIRHLEAEGKPQVRLTDFFELYRKLNVLGGTSPTDAAEKSALMTRIFGNDAANWQAARVTKYDPKGVPMVADRYGLLPVNAFMDIYLDNANADLARLDIALRIRTVGGENNPFAQVNYKPGHGHFNPATNVSNRIEDELIVAAEVMDNPSLLTPLLNDPLLPVNPHQLGRQYAVQQGHDVPAVVANAPGSEIAQFSGIGSNRRFKFELENKKTLVAFEASADLCATLCVGGDGLPIRCDKDGNADPHGTFFQVSCFAQLEPEANHMQGAVGGATPAPPAPSGPVQAPTIHVHGLQDLQSPVFQTDPGYRQFNQVMPSFQETLFGAALGTPAGPKNSRQKNALGQALAGRVPLSAAEKQQYAQELEATRRFRAGAAPILEQALATYHRKVNDAAQRFASQPTEVTKAKNQARKELWAAFGTLNPLDYIDVASLPK